MKVDITVSNRKGKKMTAVFYDDSGKRLKTVHFGSKPNKDFTIYSRELGKAEAEQKRSNYIKRHQVREDFGNPQTAGALSRWILWNKPTVASSVADFRRRFKLTPLSK